MKFNKKIVSLIAILLLIFTVVGCKKEADFAVVGSNLADYQETGVKADNKEVSLNFNQQLA